MSNSILSEKALSDPKVFSVPEISCDHCVTAITTEVMAVADVADVVVDLDAKTVAVTGGNEAAIIAAIDEAGFDVA